jgi:hypothetical protein
MLLADEHHGTDVLAGLTLGCFVAAFFYIQARMSKSDDSKDEDDTGQQRPLSVAEETGPGVKPVGESAARESLTASRLELGNLNAAAEIAKAGRMNPFA